MRPQGRLANVITMPASTTGGQQGVIAEDRRLRRAGAKEGAPSSKNSLSYFIACIGGTLFQRQIYISVYYLYRGHPPAMRVLPGRLNF